VKNYSTNRYVDTGHGDTETTENDRISNCLLAMGCIHGETLQHCIRLCLSRNIYHIGRLALLAYIRTRL